MSRLGLYFHTLRYLKPVQVFGRLWFRLYSPTIRDAPPPLPVRRQAGEWRKPIFKPVSLLSPSRFLFLNEEHELPSAEDWNNPVWEKLWLYHLHYFDDLVAEGAKERKSCHGALIERWVAGESAEIVEREGVGLTFEPENVAELCDKLETLRRDAAMYRRFKENCLAAARRYDRAVIAGRMLEILLNGDSSRLFSPASDPEKPVQLPIFRKEKIGSRPGFSFGD